MEILPCKAGGITLFNGAEMKNMPGISSRKETVEFTHFYALLKQLLSV